MQQAIVVGGAGFIGTHLVNSLSGDEWSVHVLDLVPPLALPDRAHFHQFDVRRGGSAAGLPNEPDLVVDLAAVHREPGHAAHEYFETNVEGTKSVLALCDRLGARDLVFTSSISVYGVTQVPVLDGHPRCPETPYGESKALAEDLCLEWGATEGRRVSIVRPGVVFGPGEGGNVTRLARALERGVFVFPGRRDTIKGCGYVHDLVRAMRFMHGRDEALIYNFAFAQPVTVEQICAELCRVGGYRAPRGVLPLGLMRAAGRVADAIPPLSRATGLSRRRIEKLVTPTDVRPATLIAAGFEFDFDMPGAVEHWWGAEPRGVFR